MCLLHIKRASYSEHQSEIGIAMRVMLSSALMALMECFLFYPDLNTHLSGTPVNFFFIYDCCVWRVGNVGSRILRSMFEQVISNNKKSMLTCKAGYREIKK